MAAVVAVVAAVAWSAWVITSGDDGEDKDLVVNSATATPTTPPKPPQAPVEPALPVRIVIPGIGVDAEISLKGLDANGMMQPPNGPEDVAWYNFTARPGSGGNAVFSAHVDYHDYGPAVFAGLRELAKGDPIEIRLADATVYRYSVVVSAVYDAATAPVEDIIGATTRETITLITCTGSFDSASRQYDQRLVVRAERA